MGKKWYIYMLRCKNNSIYTGITIDYKRRLIEHNLGLGAKYTRVFKPKYFEIIFYVENRSFASKVEYFIKKMSRNKKEQLILNSKIFVEILIKNFSFEINMELKNKDSKLLEIELKLNSL